MSKDYSKFVNILCQTSILQSRKMEWIPKAQRKFLSSNNRNNANNKSRPNEIKTIKAQIAQLQIEAVVCSVEHIYDKSKGTPQRRIIFRFRFQCCYTCAINNALMIKSNNGTHLECETHRCG